MQYSPFCPEISTTVDVHLTSLSLGCFEPAVAIDGERLGSIVIFRLLCFQFPVRIHLASFFLHTLVLLYKDCKRLMAISDTYTALFASKKLIWQGLQSCNNVVCVFIYFFCPKFCFKYNASSFLVMVLHFPLFLNVAGLKSGKRKVVRFQQRRNQRAVQKK